MDEQYEVVEMKAGKQQIIYIDDGSDGTEMSTGLSVEPFVCPGGSIDEVLLRYVFDRELYQKQPSEILVDILGFHCTRSSMFESLASGMWLDDSVINVAIAMLSVENRKSMPDGSEKYTNWYLPTYFSQAILSGKCGDVVEHLIRCYKGPNRYIGDPNSCKQVYIPLNESNDHWYLCLIDVNLPECWIVDPLPSSMANHARLRSVNKMKECIADIMERLEVDNTKVNKLRNLKVQPSMCTNQPNGVDCGLFIIRFMQHDTFFVPHWNSECERAKLVKELTLSDHNTQKQQILDKLRPNIGSPCNTDVGSLLARLSTKKNKRLRGEEGVGRCAHWM